MSNINSYADISSIVNALYDDVVFTARDQMLMPGLVTQFTDMSGAAVRTIYQYGTANVAEIGETEDLTSQAFTPSALGSLTPSEYGAQFALTDYRMESDPYSVLSEARVELGQRMAQAIDVALLGDFNTFTAGTIGASGSVLTWGYVLAMYTKLRAAYAPLPYAFVCTPNQAYRLTKAVAAGATVTNAPELQNEAARSMYITSAYGIDIYASAYCEASSTDAYAGMFSRQALALDWRRAPRLEADRDPSARLSELNLSAVFAHGVWRPTWGVAGLFANAAPDGTS